MVPINRRRASEELFKALVDSSEAAYKFTLFFPFTLLSSSLFIFSVLKFRLHTCTILAQPYDHKQMHPRQLS